MNQIKTVVLSIILTSIIVSLCEFFSPNDSFKKRIKLLTGTLFLICLLSPIKEDFNFPEFEFDTLELRIQNYEYIVARGVFQEISVVLDRYNLKNTSVEIQTETGENESVIIENVCIELDVDNFTGVNKLKQEIEEITNSRVEINDE